MIKMDQSDFIKTTDEWKAINRIWKSCSPEQKAQLNEEFKMLVEFIRLHRQPKLKSWKKDNYAYLSKISPEAKQFVISMVEQGEKNIYHSLMAIIDNKPELSCEELREYYFQKYGERRPYLLENKDYVSEVIELCWNKFHDRR